MKTILTFDGQDVETLSREELIAAVWELAEENKRLTAAANRGIAARVEEYKRQAGRKAQDLGASAWLNGEIYESRSDRD